MTNQPAREETTVAATFDAKTILVDISHLHGSLRQVTAVMHIFLADLSEQLIHEILAKTDGTTIIHHQDVVTLQDEEQALQ